MGFLAFFTIFCIFFNKSDTLYVIMANKNLETLTIISLPGEGGGGGGRDKKLIFSFLQQQTIYFGLLCLQIILFSVSGSANNLFQHFPFPTPLANRI